MLTKSPLYFILVLLLLQCSLRGTPYFSHYVELIESKFYESTLDKTYTFLQSPVNDKTEDSSEPDSRPSISSNSPKEQRTSLSTIFVRNATPNLLHEVLNSVRLRPRDIYNLGLRATIENNNQSDLMELLALKILPPKEQLIAAMRIAILENKNEILKSLLKIANGNFITTWDRRNSLLHHAVEVNNTTAIDLLTPYSPLIEAKNEFGKTPIFYAKTAQSCEQLIQARASIDMKDETGQTPLHQMASENLVEVAETLLKANANPDVAEQLRGFTPLHFASSKEMIELLLTYGAAINQKDASGYEPLHTAVSKGNVIAVHTLLDQGSEIDAQGGKNNKGPLHLVRTPEMLALLLEYDLDLDQEDGHGNTGLHHITKHIQSSELRKKMLRQLIEKGANADLKNNQGRTAWDLARKEHFLDENTQSDKAILEEAMNTSPLKKSKKKKKRKKVGFQLP